MRKARGVRKARQDISDIVEAMCAASRVASAAVAAAKLEEMDGVHLTVMPASGEVFEGEWEELTPALPVDVPETRALPRSA